MIPRTLAGIIAACLLATSLTGCASVSAGGVDCTYNVHNVHQSSNPLWMDVKTTGSCNGYVDQINITVAYQKLTSSGWKDVQNSVTNRIYFAVPANSRSRRCQPTEHIASPAPIEARSQASW